MDACRICGGEMGPGDCLEHIGCGAEWGRRYVSGECVRCGAPGDKRMHIVCRTCRIENAPYRGYPGGV